MTDHYDTLGVDRDATPDQIRKAYKKKASDAHPDRQGGDDKAMAAINAARDCLMDEQRRIQYDATGQDGPEFSREE
jgi:molecular chaperone DnaJ